MSVQNRMNRLGDGFLSPLCSHKDHPVSSESTRSQQNLTVLMTVSFLFLMCW